MIDIEKIKTLMAAAAETPWFASKAIPNHDDQITVSIGQYELPDNKDFHYEDTICDVWNSEYDAAACAELICTAVNFLPVFIQYVEDEKIRVEAAIAKGCADAENDEAREAYIAGFEQALYNAKAMTASDFFESWDRFGRPMTVEREREKKIET